MLVEALCVARVRSSCPQLVCAAPVRGSFPRDLRVELLDRVLLGVLPCQRWNLSTGLKQTQGGAMARGKQTRRARPEPPPQRRERSLPDWLRDALGPAAQLLAVSLATTILNRVGVAPVAGECSGGESQPPVAVISGHAGRMPEPGVASGRGSPDQ